MIYQGPIFIELRTKLLNFYPQKVWSSWKSSMTCSDWLNRGAYNIVSIKNNELIIHSDNNDFASMWLTEVENLMNHCYEHIKELYINNRENVDHCDAWQVVTLYYYGYFAVQAFLRLIGHPIVFLSKDQVKPLSTIFGTTKKMNAGNYEILKNKNISATESEYIFKKLNQQNHDAVWKSFFTKITSLLKTVNNIPNEEILFFKSLTSNVLKPVYNMLAWPPRLRTMVNYRPGFAYRTIQKDNIAKSNKLILDWEEITESKIQTLLDQAIGSCAHTSFSKINNHTNLLSCLSHSIFILVRSLYKELRSRRSIDKRWETGRLQFCNSFCSIKTGQFQFLSNVKIR